MRQWKNGIQWITAALIAVLCFTFLHCLYPYHLYLKEQLTLFLATPDYFLSYFGKPAWLALYAGDFFTQFFYFKGGGPTVITITLLVLWWLSIQTLKQFRVTGRLATVASPVLVIPEFLMLCGLHYKLGSTFSLILALAAFLIYSRLRPGDSRLRTFVLLLILIPFLYWIAGSGVFLFLLCVIIFTLVQKKPRIQHLIFPLCLALLIPLAAKPVYLLPTGKLYLYPRSQHTTLTIDMVWEKVLSMDSESFWGHWDYVLDLADKYQLKNPVATYFTNLALSQTGMMPDRLMDYYQPATKGLFLPVSAESTPMTILFSNEVFFRLGDMNMAQHSAMLGMIFSPDGRSSRLVRRLADIHIINGEYEAADKYLRMLEQTLFHKRQASVRREQIRTGSIPERVNIPAFDSIRRGDDCIASLNILLESNPGNKAALDYLLCYHLLNKDIPSFMEVYERWIPKDGSRVPDIYSQAILIYLTQHKVPAQAVRSYGIPDNILVDFMDYTRLYQENNAQSQPLRERFGKSYWFYYHFAVMVNHENN